jgi:hypothetical protein
VSAYFHAVQRESLVEHLLEPKVAAVKIEEDFALNGRAFAELRDRAEDLLDFVGVSEAQQQPIHINLQKVTLENVLFLPKAYLEETAEDCVNCGHKEIVFIAGRFFYCQINITKQNLKTGFKVIIIT